MDLFNGQAFTSVPVLKAWLMIESTADIEVNRPKNHERSA